MYRKFYKMLIIGNLQATFLHIPNRNNGIAWVHGCTEPSNHAVMQTCRHADMQLCNSPLPQFSKTNIPLFQLRSEAELSSFTWPYSPMPHFENCGKIYFSVDFLSFLYYIRMLNGSGKLIFRCCPRRKRLFARGSNKEVSGAQKGVLEPVENGSESGG
jgi:hypothetical protein